MKLLTMNIRDLRELESSSDEDGDDITIDEIDANTGEVKSQMPEHELEEPEMDEEDEFDDEDDEFDEEPDFDELAAIDAGFEGEE